MGVPKFAAWLTKKYPAMVIDKCPDDVHGLYIDLNGLIHPCCHDEHDATVALRTELEKMRSICLAIETLVVTVKPKHVLYIAIDGVAPRAKMNQQRARRYMSAGTPLTNTAKPIHGGGGEEMSAGVVAAIEKEFTAAEKTGAEEDLEDVNQALLGDVLYGGVGAASPVKDTAMPAAAVYSTQPSVDPLLPPLPTTATPTTTTSADAGVAGEDKNERFDSNCISPGTAFMDKVAAAVRDFVKRKLTVTDDDTANANSAGDPLTCAAAAAAAAGSAARASPWRGLTVVFSDSNTAGEGEHKFLDFLRTQAAFPGFNGGGCHVIAGLDADLIFLSLSLHIPRVVILRDHDRSSYEKALLPLSEGGTLVPSAKADKRKKGGAGRGGKEELSRSNSTSSIGSAAATPSSTITTVTTTTRKADADEGGASTIVTPSSRREDFTEETDGVESFAGSGSPSAVSSPPASPAPPPHIASVVAEACPSYEYYDIDVVGASIVSEVYQLWREKGMEVQGNPLANLANCVASNGFNFHHSGGATSAEGEVAAAAPSVSAAAAAAFHPCTSTSNSKIVDDFIVLAMLLGNDFLPHSPSVYCGESAMDTLLDVYVSSVLPYGYLTGGLYEIQLLQLERLLRGYSAVEAVRFRQHAIQANLMTPQEAATSTVYSPADKRCWRDVYIRSTSLRDEAGVQAACRAYVEGLRFVWRYYSSISLQVSWSWYYPFHHAPLARDVADFLKSQGPNVQATLAAPKLERAPPPPFCQLLCILPPTSRRLVPAALRPPMMQPPPELVDTFPKTWTVDFTGAYGKDHLAAVLLPFANLPHLQKLVQEADNTYTTEEHARNALRSTHLVIESRAGSTGAGDDRDNAGKKASNDTGSNAVAETKEKEKERKDKPKRGAAAAAARARGFHVQGNGLQPLSEADVPVEFQNCAAIVCSSLADVVPPLSRPRTYSHTVAIPNLTVLPDGSRVPIERRPQNRYGNRRGRRPTNAKGGKEENDKSKSNASSAANVQAAKPAMLFGELVVTFVIIGVLTAMVAVRRTNSLINSVQLTLQLSGIALTVLGLVFALGLAVANKGRTAGSGMHRHNIFTAFADWQCAQCLSMNFSRNRRCFMCRAPFDPHRCVALFSGRNAPEPPLMDPDHAAYAASYGITSL